MAKSAGRKASRRVPLNRGRVLRAAIAIADNGGLEALTMAAVGTQLGVQSMSLYRHVRNKDDILDGIVDIVFGEIALPASGADWKTAMRRRAISLREVLSRHSWAIALMESLTRPGPANLRHHDSVLATLRGAGFSSLMATRAYNLLNSYVYGFALQEVSLPVATPDDLAELGKVMLQQLADEYPHLAAVGADLMRSGFAYADEFEVGLDLILDGIERIEDKSGSRPTTS